LPGIDADAVGVLGGSEGANVALIAGARGARTAFVIVVSGSMGTSVLDVLRYSAEKRGYALGLTEDEIARAVTFKEIAFAILSGADIVEWPLVEDRVARWEGEPWAELIDVAKKRRDDLAPAQKQAMLDSFRRVVDEFSAERWFGAVDAAGAVQRFARLNIDAFFALIERGPYARDWDQDLCADAAAIRCPVLAIWGADDSFLPPRQSAARLEKMLSDAGHTDHTIRIFDGAGHFLTTSGPDADFAPGYVELLARWVADRRGVR
jgi:pimeloyl-ACP methyl ester carboxylesterase